ncbi:MAG: spoIIIJ-associated protein [Bradymonadia bacterium]|jgi:spoIIIJ-associated protein
MNPYETAVGVGRDFLNGLFERMEIELKITDGRVDDDAIILRIEGETTKLRRRTDLQAAFSDLCAQTMARSIDVRFVRCVLDMDGDFAARKALLETAAGDLAHAVSVSGRNAVLDGLSNNERRVVHTALKDHAAVATHSEGEDDRRLLIVTSKGARGA